MRKLRLRKDKQLRSLIAREQRKLNKKGNRKKKSLDHLWPLRMCLVMENSVYVLLEGLGLCRSFSVRAPTFPSGTVQGLGSMWRSDEKASGYSLSPHDLTRHLHSALAFQKLCSSNSFFTDKLNRGQRVVICPKSYRKMISCEQKIDLLVPEHL